MRKSELASKLSRLEGFEQPNIELEQYVTPPQLAADIIHTAYMQEDIEGNKVLDLGTGNGILAIGAALSGGEVTAVEKDPEALEVAKENAEKAGVEDRIELREEDVKEVEGGFDTCVMNPPFSVHSESLETFFSRAFSLADAVYSVAPGDCERIKELAEDHQHDVLGVEAYSIGLESSYGFHTEESRKTDVKMIVTRTEKHGT